MRERWEGIVRKFGSFQEIEMSFSEGSYLIGHPLVKKIERKLSQIFSGKTLLTNCGLSAIGLVLQQVTEPGKAILASKFLFPRTLKLIESLRTEGIEVRWVDPRDLRVVKKKLNEWPLPSVYFVEILGNSPSLPVVDWEETLQLLKGKEIFLVVDTTLWPAFKPLKRTSEDFEDQIVEVSSFKWESSFDMVTAGRITACNEKLIEEIRNSVFYRMVVIQPLVAKYLLVNEKHSRFDIASHKALQAAEILEGSSKIEKVWYPGLESHCQNDLVKKQFEGKGGGIVYFKLKDSTKIKVLIDNLIKTYWWSLGSSFGGEEWRILPFKFLGGFDASVIRISAGLNQEGMYILRDVLSFL